MGDMAAGQTAGTRTAGATCWAWRRLRAVHGPEQTLVRLRFNASAACRGLKWTGMGEITQEARGDAMRGEDMQLIKVYTKVPRPRALEICEEECIKSAEAWVDEARRRGLTIPPSYDLTATELFRVAASTAPPPPARAEYREHCARVPEPTDQQVLAPEDNDPSTAWLQLKEPHFLRGRYFLCRDAGWQRANIRVGELVSTMRAAHTTPEAHPHFN